MRRQCLILHISPFRPPCLQCSVAVPFPCFRGPETIPGHLPHTQQDMSMMVTRIIPLFRLRLMDRNISHHTLTNKLILDEGTNKLEPVF